MKRFKNITILTIFLITALFLGCSGNNNNPQQNTVAINDIHSSEENIGESTEDIYNKTFNIKRDVKEYIYIPSEDFYSEIKVKSALYVYQTGGGLIDICIIYPQITNMPDLDDYTLRDAINKNIFDDILVEFGFYEFQNIRLSANIDFEVTFLDNNKIFINYYGDATYISHYNKFEHSVSFDMNTGEKLSDSSAEWKRIQRNNQESDSP